MSSRNVRFCRSEVDGAAGGLSGDGGCSRRACGLALPAIWVVAHLWGCGTGKPDGPEEAAVVVRDSAGVRLVEFGLDVWGNRPMWFVSATPEVELRPGMAGASTAGGDSAYEFFGVSGLERLSTGEIVVANGGTQELRVFSSEGRHLRTLGRRGEGPGEFMDLAFIDVVGGDSIATFDRHLRRITLVDVGSGGLRVLDGTSLDATIRMATHVLEAGSIVWEKHRNSFREGIWSDSLTVVLSDANGMTTDSVGVFDGTEFMYSAGTRYVERRPFGREFRTATGDSLIYVADGGEYSILVFSTSSRRSVILRGLFPAQTVTAEMFEDLLSMWIADSRDPVRQADLEKLRGTKPYPAMTPPHGELLIATTGDLLVQDFSWNPKESQIWRIFDADHVPKASLTVPPGLRVLYVNGSGLGGLREDEYGIERIAFYDIIRN